VAAGVGTGGGRCGNGQKAVAAAKVGVPLTLGQLEANLADPAKHEMGLRI
jgi:hypothetical protein